MHLVERIPGSPLYVPTCIECGKEEGAIAVGKAGSYVFLCPSCLAQATVLVAARESMRQRQTLTTFMEAVKQLESMDTQLLAQKIVEVQR